MNMAYKISGTTNSNATILIMNEDGTIDRSEAVSTGAYDILH